MMMTDTVTAEELRQLLLYDPDTGKLTWRNRHENHFPEHESSRRPGLRALAWNAKNAGKEAFTSGSRYLIGAVYGKTYRAHRVAWALHYGEWPSQCIDHINGIGVDNRLANLRLASHAENMRNQKLRNTNKSGVCGVSWNKGRAKGFWVATIGQSHIGSFATFEDAVAARKNAEAKYGYHANHGRSA